MPRPIVTCINCGEDFELRPHQKIVGAVSKLRCADCDQPVPVKAETKTAPKKERKPQSAAALHRAMLRDMVTLLRSVEELAGEPAYDIRAIVANYVGSIAPDRAIRELADRVALANAEAARKVGQR